VKPAFKIVQGNLPLLTATLTDAAGAPVVLTGCTVAFAFQLAPQGTGITAAATVTDALNGKVSYQFAAGQTAAPGFYRGQWRVANGPALTLYPACGYFDFEIIGALPLAAASFDKLADFYDDIRAVAGDLGRRKIYEDGAIAGMMRHQLRMKRVRQERRAGGCTVWTLTPDIMGLAPAITNDDTLAYALLVYHTAHQLVLPNLEAYSYRTRALAERFGERKDFLFVLQNTLYDLENGEGAYANVSGLRNWLFAVNGIWVWSWLQAEQNIELSFH